MNHSHEETMKKISVVNLDKLLDNFSEIEKVKINEINNLLVLRLEKCNRLLTLSQSKEESVKEGKLFFKSDMEYKDQIEKLMIEIKNKEEDHKLEITQLNCDIRKKYEVKEVEYREQREKRELEILELTRQLKIQNEEKQNEIIKLQIEFNAKLARVQNKTTKSFADASVFPQSIYRRKLQHLQEEKNNEIEILRDTIRNLEQRLIKAQDLHLKQRRL
uniref:Coiled-coil domain containing 152 n=1 Tax=Strix occidentalis caurina TaxID=311401 RepID=A0A8D0ESD5_STROC